MKLTTHFVLEEFLISQEATRRGIDNTPPPDVLDNLRMLAATLEIVREVLGHPIVISSGYRCPELNRLVGGSSISAHLEGLAADFTCPGYGTPLQVARTVAAIYRLKYDQVIHEYRSWVHLSVDPRARMQRLTIDSTGTRQGLLP